MTSAVENLYTSLPEGVRPVAQKLYYLLNPRLSWSYRKRHDAVDESFVERFFDDEEEYRTYRTEFFESEIVDVCMTAEGESPEGYSIYDAHRKDCVRYYALVRKRRPDVLVETGVYSGVSTLSMLLALERNGAGRLYSIDSTNAIESVGDSRARFFARGRPSCSEAGSAQLPPGREPGWLVPDRLGEHWELRTGRSQRDLPDLLAELGGVDFFLHDSEHSATAMLFEFELAWEWLNRLGLILSSHVEWNDAFRTFVDERDCEHGLSSFFYLDLEGERTPCATGYILKR